MKNVLLIRLFSITLFLLNACSLQQYERKTDPSLFFKNEVGLTWPAAPNKPRLRLVKIIDSIEDFKKTVRIETKTSQFVRWLIGEVKEPFESFERPYFAMAKDGRIYVVDQGLFLVVVLDLKEGEVLYLQKTADDDILFYPTSLTIDDEGNIYVSDPEKNRIVIYDKKGYLLEIT